MKRLLRKMDAFVVSIAMGFVLNAATPPSSGQTYYGLFVGVNYYSNGVNSLFGCDRDAVNMLDAYTASGFCAATNATAFIDYAATKAVVREKFAELAGKARAGDTVLYYQSSHGGDYDDDKGSCLCMTDDDWLDTEFAEDLEKFVSGVRVVVIIDACYSGGMFKAAGVSSRAVSRKRGFDFAVRVQRHLKSRLEARKGADAKGGASVGWITACDWDELSTASAFGSIFTNAIIDGWRDGSADVDSDGYVSFSELATYAVDNVDYDEYEQTTQVDNESLLSSVLAGSVYDLSVFRPLVLDDTFYGFVGTCPASVTIPSGVERIAESAFDTDFNDTWALESVTIPSSVTEIDEYAFYECGNLATVTFEGDISDIWFEGGMSGVFDGTPWLDSLRAPNDDFADAIRLPAVMEGGAVGTNLYASLEEDEPLVVDWDAVSTVWWTWTAPATGPVQFNMFGSDFDTIMGVYTGDSLDGLMLVADNDDAKDSEGTQSQVAFNAVAGTTYYIAVGGYDDVGGISLNWSPYDVEFSFVVEDGILTGFNGICPASIMIPDGVTSIGEEAFFNCNLLESVTFNESLESIGERAFAWCVSLTNVALPAGLSAVEHRAFEGCSSLAAVSLGGRSMAPDSEELTAIMDVSSVFVQTPWLGVLPPAELGWCLYRDDAIEAALSEGKRILLVSGRDTCPNTTYLRETACYDPDVMEILQEGFILWYNDCDNMGEEVWDYAEGLDTYALPLVCVLDPYDMDTYIERSTGFMDEDDLYDFLTNLPDWPSEVCLKVEDGWVTGYFGEMPDGELLDLEIPDGVVGIEDGALAGLAGLRSLYIPASVTYIGEYAFEDCADLEEIFFEEKEAELVECEWTDEDDVTHSWSYFGFGETLEIGANAFSGCESLAWLDIPAHAGCIGESAFSGCSSLGSVCFLADDSATESYLEIGEYAFEGCESLETVSFDDRPFDPENDVYNAIYIGESAFEGCELLSDLYLGEGVEEIGVSAFYGCGIESLEIPASVTYIGEVAFAYCESLEEVYFAGFEVYGNCYEIDVDISCAFEGTPWLEVPSNDNFADAELLVGDSGVVAGRNRNATVENGEVHKCFPTATVWYKWTPTMTGAILFGVYADYDSVIGVYTGTAVGALERIAFNDDSDDDFSSVVAFNAIAGTTYYVAVGGYGDSNGSFEFEWEPYESEIDFVIDENGVLTGCECGYLIPSTLDIPEGVTAIENEVFEEWDEIRTVNLPSTLKSIGAYAFAWCYDLTTVNGLTEAVEVGKQAFWATPFDETRPFGLDIVDNCVVGFHGPCATAVTIPEGVTNIAEWAFSFWDYSLEEETYDAVEDEWYGYDVCSLTNLTSLTIPASMVSISEWAFEDCTNLVKVAIENPEILIDGSAFFGCANLGIDVEKVGHTLVGWDLFREKNPVRRICDEYEEYEPAVIPTGTVVRVEDILTPLVYGMPTDKLLTNWVWDVEVGDYVIGDIILVTNTLNGVWATPSWRVDQYTLTFDAAGGSDIAPIMQDYGTAVTLPAAPTRTGYTFVGWFSAARGGVQVTASTIVTGNLTCYAHWTANRYTVTFDPNGGTGTMAAQAFAYDVEQNLSECAFTRSAHEFMGWSLAADSDVIACFGGENVLNLTAAANGNVTLYAVWERSTLWAPADNGGGTQGGGSSGGAEQGDAMFDGEAAETYDGYVYTEDGVLKGTIQVKTAKAKTDRKTEKKLSKITATLQLTGEKKLTARGNLDVATGEFDADVGGRALAIVLGANGVTGTYGPYLIDGAQNKFMSRDASDKAEGAAALSRWQGVYTVARKDAAGWSGFSLTVAAKGKVKVQGTLADGTKVSASGQLLVGEGGVCAIPVVIAKKANVAFNVWLTDEGVEVVGLDGEVAVGRLGTLAGGAHFSLDRVAFSALLGDDTYSKYLPDGLTVAQNGTNLVVADGAKAGKVQLAKNGSVDESKAGDNPSALKLTYTAKTGLFKGTFKAYVVANGKPKAVAVTVTGIMVGAKGFGAATIKKIGGVPVTIGINE